ncbi:Uncharacterized protein Rs2_38798 [Raphanus sativus]|nr:Uncharacterized protein Rs2_38798 [Raphanus sativus]
MATARSQGRDPLFVSSSSSSSKSVRAAAIRIRFADIIVKSSSNKSEAMMKIRREKQLQEEKARMKLRQEARLAVLKVEEEEARSDCRYENPLSVEKELLNLIGGSRRARDRSLLKQFGLVLKPNVDDDVLDDLDEDLRDDKLFFIDHHVAVHVTSAQIQHIIFCQIGFVLTPFVHGSFWNTYTCSFRPMLTQADSWPPELVFCNHPLQYGIDGDAGSTSELVLAVFTIMRMLSAIHIHCRLQNIFPSQLGDKLFRTGEY